MEWPRNCAYWNDSRVVSFTGKHNLMSTSLDGCAYGMTVSSINDRSPTEEYVMKPWRIASNCLQILAALSQKCICSYPHRIIEGSMTHNSAYYPVMFVNHVLEALSAMCEYGIRTCNMPMNHMKHFDMTIKSATVPSIKEVRKIAKRWGIMPHNLIMYDVAGCTACLC